MRQYYELPSQPTWTDSESNQHKGCLFSLKYEISCVTTENNGKTHDMIQMNYCCVYPAVKEGHLTLRLVPDLGKDGT
jgi:hypothetical protein